LTSTWSIPSANVNNLFNFRMNVLTLLKLIRIALTKIEADNCTMPAEMTKRSAKMPRGVLGYTHDGVAILRPAVKSKHFTIAEARRIFRELREDEKRAARTGDASLEKAS
jgi:hypothetical protein